MQKNLRLTILVLSLLSVLLFVLIVGPEINGTIEAANGNGNSLKSEGKQGDAGSSQSAVSSGTQGEGAAAGGSAELPPNHVDSSKEPTDSAIDKDEGLKDVTDEILEPDVTFELKYDQYPLTYLYLAVLNNGAKIRSGPGGAEPVIRTAGQNEKLNYLETITNDGLWYHVTWNDKDQQKFGFVSADAVTKRVFQFNKMDLAVQKAEKAFAAGPLTYINNYHNLKGNAPKYKGKDQDNGGNRRSQSAPGYPNPADLSEFSYLGDGTLVRILSTGSEYTRVAQVKDEKVFFVPNQYVAMPAAVYQIGKAIIIDRENQNEAVFEKIGDQWRVISYTLATTGKVGTYHQPTPLGYYYAMEKRERFYYYEDGTTKIQGYAPYAVRFAGGAYVHGVPVNYKFASDGSRIDPGKIEYSKTLGTVPLSHKCVRNYTSHAKFLYDWYTPGNTIVIVIE
ncbi:L,D-transpeptidase family protein [Anoxybacterium hadale]|uniref:L,D-transpeptidase family protein n=1 Tax=Anoxybacterium hadale TaxID=3408580 RepID=UPI003AFF6F4B